MVSVPEIPYPLSAIMPSVASMPSGCRPGAIRSRCARASAQSRSANAGLWATSELPGFLPLRNRFPPGNSLPAQSHPPISFPPRFPLVLPKGNAYKNFGEKATLKTVYLDTNMWIELKRASLNGADPRRRIVEHVWHRVEEGSLRLPLSITHCLEMVKHGDHEKRRQLWTFATHLSGCFGMINKQVLLRSLIDEAVLKVFGTEIDRAPIEVFTRSGLFGLEFKRQYALTDLILTTEDGWVSFWIDMPDDIHQSLFQGLRNFEEGFIKRRNELKESWRNCDQSLRKRAHIARLFMDMQDQYLQSMTRLGRDQGDIECLEMEDRLRLITEVPPLDVEVSLAVQHQQQWDRQEVINDVRDISHLCMSIPYCDVVITERYWVDKIKRAKLDEKYGTQVSSDLSFLLQI